MKISAETLSIIKSFSAINPVMYFGDPKAIKVQSSKNGLVGVYQSPEVFDKQCAFWEMPQLLAVIESMDGEKAELTFDEKYVKITNESNMHVNYMYTPEAVIINNNKKPKDFENYVKPITADFEFDIDSETLGKILKLTKVMNLNTIKFSFNDGKGEVTVINAETAGNNFTTEIKGTGTGEISFDINNLNIINGDYHVIVKSKVFGKWTNKNIPLFYIAGAKKE